MLRQGITATILIAAVAAGGYALAHNGGTATAGAAVTGQAATGASVANTTNGTGSSTPQNRGSGRAGGRGGFIGGPGGRFGFGGFGGFEGFGGERGAVLTVTGVNGNTINATARGGQAITVTVSSTTAYTEAGAAASLSDVTSGETIAVKGTVTSATAIQATAVTIVLPTESGVVTNVNGSTLTISDFSGTQHTITVGSSTRYDKAGASGSLSDISTGSAIVAEGTLNSDGSLNAVRITIRYPIIVGKVTAVNGSTYTVSGAGKGEREYGFGATGAVTYTVNATSSTTYVSPTGTTASASTITTGTYIAAEGTLSSDGKTLTALRIAVLPTSSDEGFGPGGFLGRGGGRHGGGWSAGGFGQGFSGIVPGQGNSGSTTTPSTSSTSTTSNV